MQTRKLRNRLRRTRSKYSRAGQKTRKHLGGAVVTPPKVVYGRLHAKWCGHCHALQKIWPSVVREINNKTKKEEYKSVSIEQSEEARKLPWVNKQFVKTGNPLAVQGGYPTLFKIVDGKVHYYEGERSVPSIVQFVVKTA